MCQEIYIRKYGKSRLVFLFFFFAEKPTFLFVKKQVSAFSRQKSAGEHNAETRDIVYSKTNFGERESCA